MNIDKKITFFYLTW